MLKQRIEQLIKILIYFTFLCPLVVIPSSYIFPFIVPKILFFRSLVEIMFFLYLGLLFINWEQYKPKFNYINVGLSLFLLSFAISTFSGVDIYHSFWDNHERMLGLFTLMHYLVYYFICVAILRDWKDWKWAGRFFLLTGAMVMFIGWLQTQNPNLLLNRGSDRVASTLGNPIYVGGFGLFLAFLALLLMSKEKNVLWRWFYGISGFLGFMGMFWSGTRGSMLGFVFACAFAIFGYILVLKNYPKIRYGLIGAAALGVLGISLLYTFKTTEFVTNLPAIGRAVNTSFADVKSSARWVAWEISIESWKEKPIFGWGPNNYFYTFNSHYNPKSLDFGYGETWFDNAHNILVNTLAVQGAVGLITYLAVFVLAMIALIDSFRKKYIDYHFMIISGAFLVGHFVGNITVFENPTSYLYFMFWLALIAAMTGQMDKSSQINTVDKKVGVGTLSAGALLCLLIIFIFNIQPARANNKTLLAVRSLSQDPIAGLPLAKEALLFQSPHIDDIRSDISRSALQILLGSWQKLGKDKTNEWLNLLVENLEKNLLLHPLDIRNQLTLAQIYQLEMTVNNNSLFLLKSESVLEDALKKSPKRQQIIYSLVGIKVQLNKSPEAVKMLEEAIKDNPRIGESYWRLAYVYKIMNQEDKARSILRMAGDNGIIFSEQEQGIISQFIFPTSSIKKTK